MVLWSKCCFCILPRNFVVKSVQYTQCLFFDNKEVKLKVLNIVSAIGHLSLNIGTNLQQSTDPTPMYTSTIAVLHYGNQNPFFLTPHATFVMPAELNDLLQCDSIDAT